MTIREMLNEIAAYFDSEIYDSIDCIYEFDDVDDNNYKMRYDDEDVLYIMKEKNTIARFFFTDGKVDVDRLETLVSEVYTSEIKKVIKECYDEVNRDKLERQKHKEFVVAFLDEDI